MNDKPDFIDNAENESGEECTTNITEAADSNHDEKDHQIFKGEDRLDAAKDLDAKAATKRCHAATEGKGPGEDAARIDTARLGHAPIVDRGPNFSADAGSLQTVEQPRDNYGAGDNHKDAVFRKDIKAEIDTAF